MGITRLNVYAGEAAGYVITDAVEQDMINGTNVSGVNITCGASPVMCESPSRHRHSPDHPGQDLRGRRDNLRTGSHLELGYYRARGSKHWRPLVPHVYMTVQNPWDLTGTNAFGRWHYGPWFNPPVPECVNGLPVGCIEVGPRSESLLYAYL